MVSNAQGVGKIVLNTYNIKGKKRKSTAYLTVSRAFLSYRKLRKRFLTKNLCCVIPSKRQRVEGSPVWDYGGMFFVGKTFLREKPFAKGSFSRSFPKTFKNFLKGFMTSDFVVIVCLLIIDSADPYFSHGCEKAPDSMEEMSLYVGRGLAPAVSPDPRFSHGCEKASGGGHPSRQANFDRELVFSADLCYNKTGDGNG